MPPSCNRTCWKFFSKSPFKPLDVILQEPFYCGNIHKFSRFNLAKSFNIDRPSPFVYTMVTVRVMTLNFLIFLILKILNISRVYIRIYTPKRQEDVPKFKLSKAFCYVCIQDLGQQGTLDEEAERKREEIESA